VGGQVVKQINMENKKIKKFEKQVVLDLISQIKNSTKNEEKHLKLNAKENNIIKYINPKYSQDRLGAYNGFGYEKLGKHLFSDNFKEVLKFLKKIEKSQTVEKNIKTSLSQEEKEEKWLKKLVKLTGCTLEEASEILKEKKEYKEEKIEEMEDRQSERFSVRRQKLIEKMRRENPLRAIKDELHARNILEASKRHTSTNYESLLEEGRELVKWGMIESSKEFARMNFEKI